MHNVTNSCIILPPSVDTCACKLFRMPEVCTHAYRQRRRQNASQPRRQIAKYKEMYMYMYLITRVFVNVFCVRMCVCIVSQIVGPKTIGRPLRRQ